MISLMRALPAPRVLDLGMKDAGLGVVRCYRIVSACGTAGTMGQRMLVFTTARRGAPAVLVAAMVARYRG